MGKQTVKALVEGGKAVPGPPLGPALAAAKVNIGQVVSAINEKTKEFKGIKVPIEVTIDTETKEFEISVGSPPISQLIKKEVGKDKLAKTPWTVPKPKEGEAILRRLAALSRELGLALKVEGNRGRASLPMRTGR